MQGSSTLGAAAVLATCVIACAGPAAAATRYDPALHFRSIATPHFFIHYHQGEEAEALRLSVIAEQVHADLAARLDYAAKGRTHVVLVDQDDDPNGWATPVPYDLIEVRAVPPTGASPIGNTSDWLRTVFTHKYSHILHLGQSRGMGRAGARCVRAGAIRIPEPHLAPLADRRARDVRRESRR